MRVFCLLLLLGLPGFLLTSQLVAEEPKSAAEAVALGDSLREKDDWAGAISAYDKAIQLDPRCAKAYCGRGRARGNKGDHDAAMTDFNEATRLDPHDASAYNGRGCCHLSKNDLDKAVVDFNEAIRLDPKLAAAYHNRGYLYKERRDYDKAIADFTKAIQFDPRCKDARFGRGVVYAAKTEYDSAIADLDSLIQSKPDFPWYYEVRGLLWIERGDNSRGFADFQTMLRLNPKDSATDYKGGTGKPIAPAAQEHGRQQVRQMLLDRPAMARYDEDATMLYEWAACKFGGEDLRQEILWNASEPTISTADHRVPWGDRQGHIRVAGKCREGPMIGQERSFEEMWREAVFELHNIASAETFRQLFNQAAAGKLSKEEFVTQVIQCESHAAEKTRAFYIRVFLPWAREHHVSTHPGMWFVAQSASTKGFVLPSADRQGSYWRNYESGYDMILLESLVQKGENEKAIELATGMQDIFLDNTKKFQLHCLRAQAFRQSEKYDRAIAEYSEAIRLSPDCAELYCCRGNVYDRTSEYDKAIADYTEAIRLNPNCAESRCCRGSAYASAGEYDKAIADCAKAIRIAPKNANLYVALGQVLAKKGDFDAALDNIGAAIVFDPKNDGAICLRDWVLQQKREAADPNAFYPGLQVAEPPISSFSDKVLK